VKQHRPRSRHTEPESAASLVSAVVAKIGGDARALEQRVFDGFGVAVGNFGKVADNFAQPASPDVRFYVKGPAEELFDALVEDTAHGEVVEARAPAVLLFDSPAGGNGGRIDATFTAVQFLGGFAIDLVYNGALVKSLATGTTAIIKYP